MLPAVAKSTTVAPLITDVTVAYGKIPPLLPTSVGALANVTRFVAVPRFVPRKFTVAVATRAREAAASVNVSFAPVPTDILIVELPPASVIVPTVSLDATLAVLFPTNRSVPPRSAIAAVSGMRVVLFVVPLSIRRVAP